MTQWSIALVLVLGLLGMSQAQESKTDQPKPKNPPKEVPKVDPYKLPDPDAKEWKKQADGLETWDVKVGEGDEIKKSETVNIHYTGWLLDGTIFDSSRKRDKIASFPLDRLIKGWQVGIPGMKPGGVRRLKIPYQLAYGEDGKPPTIPAKAMLIFEIELFGDPFKMPDVKHKDWKKLDNGIRTWDVKLGDGEVVKPGATVTIHYTGWNQKGVVFDSSKKGRGEPITFPLGNLIKGWQLAVPGMKIGGIRRLELPPEFAYGPQGAGADIPPNATLIFEIEVKGTK